MTPNEFVYWLKGYLAAQHDSQIKLDIERTLKQVNEGIIPGNGANSTGNYKSTPNSTSTYNIKQQLND